jgi:23S rRNA (guanosine2251-2'-O)-methyltransferase
LEAGAGVLQVDGGGVDVAALGVDGVAICGLKNINFAAMVRTSSGAMLDIPITISHNSLDLLNELKQVDFNLIGACIDGVEVLDFKKELNIKKTALVLGSEGSGLSKKVINKLDHKVKISMSNNFDSLNVSVAAGILIHTLRQVRQI